MYKVEFALSSKNLAYIKQQFFLLKGKHDSTSELFSSTEMVINK